MRWNSWPAVLGTEVVSVALSTLAGILSNVLTNETHPKDSVIIGIVIFAISSAALQAVRYKIAERQLQSSDNRLSEIQENTRNILVRQEESSARLGEAEFDTEIAQFCPEILRPWVKVQWQSDRSGVELLMRALYDPTTSPLAVVSEWEAQQPEWFRDLSWQALLVGAELANSYNGTKLSSDLFVTAVRKGATRRHYWVARAASLRKLQGAETDARQILSEGDVNSSSPDEFARIVVAFVADDRLIIGDLLEAWTPEAPIDILLSASIHGALIASDPASPTPNFVRLAAVYRDTIKEIPFSASPKLALSGTLINFVNAGFSSNRHSDLQEALDLAIQARNICRRQKTSSVEAVNLACQAAHMDGQFSKVISIGTSVTGEATREESASDLVRFFVAASALIRGQTSITDDLIPLIKDAFRRAFLTAASADFSGNASPELWREALARATNTPDKFKHSSA